MLLRRPPKELVFLMVVGIVDLVSTLVLYKMGLIEEFNPMMRVLLERSPLLFAGVKLLTLVIAFIALQLYSRNDEKFVRRASLLGATSYIGIWCIFFSVASFS